MDDFSQKIDQEIKEIQEKVDADMALEASQLQQNAEIPRAGITPNLNLKMSWVEDQKMFSMVYQDGDKAVFQILMTPASFEMLAMDMVRTVKNFNLYQAQKYQEMLKIQKEAAKSEESVGNDAKDKQECSEPSCGKGISCDPNADSGNQTQPQ